MKRLGILYLVVSGIFLPHQSVVAQLTQQVNDGAPKIIISPALPPPHTAFTAQIDDYAAGGSGGGIRWFVNSVERREWQNERKITLTAPDDGQSLQIVSYTENGNGLINEARQTITPRYLDLIVEPQTYVPSFYGARAVPSHGSQVNVTARMESGGDLAELVYTWRVNNKILFDGPVRGRSMVSFVMPWGDAYVELEVEKIGVGVIAERTIYLTNSDPELRFHEESSLLGLSPWPITDLNLISQSTTITAHPYYLDILTFNEPDIAEWSIGGIPSIGSDNNPYAITISRSNVEGSSNVSFHVRNTTNVLQGAQSDVVVSF